MEIEEDIESELSGIFRVKLVAKNITELSLHCDASFWRNIQMFWTRLLDFSIFLVKYYTSFIFVKEKLSCLINWALSFVSTRGPISGSDVAKIFHAY